MTVINTGIRDLYDNHINGNIEENGYTGVTKDVCREISFGLLRRYDKVKNSVGLNDGVYVLDRDWDMLVVLDACRPDLMREVEDEFDYFEETGKKLSVAAGSPLWMKRNFADRDLEDESIAMVTANPFSDEIFDADRYTPMDEVWKVEWDGDENTVRPDDVTEHAIHVGRNYQWDRLVVHYMQPHHPFIGFEFDDGINKKNPQNPDETVWSKLSDNKIEYDEVWNAYKENLRTALNSLSHLLSNVDAEETIVTADHGNAVGERNLYGHGGVPITAVREVPWNHATATDTGQIAPDITLSDSTVSDNVNERLRKLGYKSQ